MSYDLVVVDPRSELRERSTFMRWYASRTNWRDGFNYSNPSNATPALHAFYEEMIAIFKPLGNPLDFGTEDSDERGPVAEYVIDTDIIYMAFSWQRARLAYETTRRLAAKYAVAFFDSSGEQGEVWFPSESGGLELIHQGVPGDEDHRAFVKRIAASLDGSTAIYCNSMEDFVKQMREMDLTNPKVVIVGHPGEKSD
jgi:hypothetical protein